jgi:hypothetical protein
MRAFADALLSRQRLVALAALQVAVFVAGAVAHAEIVSAPYDLSADVHEALLPGGDIFNDSHPVTAAEPSPKQSAKYLFIPSKGENLSGRSTNIQTAFVSSLAESDGNGGAGVTSFIGGSPSDIDPAEVEQLVATASWSQTFTYTGKVAVPISLHFEIPALEVGLIGVPEERESQSKTETAQATTTLVSSFTDSSGVKLPGASFDFGLRAFEEQDPNNLPAGGLAFLNTPNFQPIIDNPTLTLSDLLGLNLFKTLDRSGPDSNPRWTIDKLSFDVELGELLPGSTVSYTFSLVAQGTTHGAEQGFVAFLGDPFGQDVVAGNLVLGTGSAAPGVSAPATHAPLVSCPSGAST